MKKMKKLSHKKFYVLTMAVVAECLLSSTPVGAAEIISGGGREVFEVNFVDPYTVDENVIKMLVFNDDKNLVKAMTISPDNQAGIMQGVQYWADILGAGTKNSAPVQIFVGGVAETKNAFAAAYNIDKGIFTMENNWVNALQNNQALIPLDMKKVEIKGTGDNVRIYSNGNLVNDCGYGGIGIGQYMGAKRAGTTDGWWTQGVSVLPDNEQAADLPSTVRHEMGHALGLNVGSEPVYGDDRQPLKDADGVPILHFGERDIPANTFLAHLYDQNLNPARKGQIILTSQEFKRQQAANPSLKPSDFFILDNNVTASGKKATTNPRSGKAYFMGKNVSEVLAGRKFDGVDGLPVQTWEKDGDNSYILDLAHLDIGGLMSHAEYRNSNIFNEAELAVLQDIGYTLDRRVYFGRSIYNDDLTVVNKQGYFARNAAGTAYLNNTYSTVPMGVGLHIYGSRNRVTQAANVMTLGRGAVGLHVAGTENTLTLPRGYEVHADGERGTGVLISYGRNQNFSQQGNVTANGKDGVAVRFDFGSNSLGADSIYRGSYISYYRNVDKSTGTITEARNTDYLDKDEYRYYAPEIDGPLVESYTLSGKISGAGNAIYIGRNAFVQNINIENGAEIVGDITSEWKHFNTDGCYDAKGKNVAAIKLQYGDKRENNGYDYDRYIYSLVTNLNFRGNMRYDGDINGWDNMKVHVEKGALTYGGKANVVNVIVEQDAALLGGSWQVNDMTRQMAADLPADETTGKVYNLGLIGAADKDKSMTITGGDLISYGTLQAYAGGKEGWIDVSGKAVLDGSRVSAINALPDEKKTVLKAGSISGTIKNPAGNPLPATGMLNTTGTISADGKILTVSTTAANNLGEINSQQAEAYRAMNTMFNRLDESGDERREEMRGLYSLDSEGAKEALSAISARPAVKSMSVAQRSTLLSHTLASRLSEAYATQVVQAALPVSQLADGEAPVLEVPVKVPRAADNDIWFKIGKNWGEARDQSYYHGTAYTLGWDRAYGKHWRGGLFASYGTVSFADDRANNRMKDTRVGLYGGYKRGPHSGYVYMDYGWLDNDLSRSIPGLNLQPKANYGGRIWELGGEYKYDLNAAKKSSWHTSPYVNVQLSRLWQDGYTEQGAGIFGQRVNSSANTYFAAGTGLEFKRYLPKGSYAFRVGVKHAFSGADPRVTFGYVGDRTSTYEMHGQQDKTQLVLALAGDAEFAPGWFLAGDAVWARGRHDHDLMCAATLRHVW